MHHGNADTTRMANSQFFLGIETSGHSTGIALIDQTGAKFSERRHGLSHNEVVLGLIRQALAAAGIEPRQLSGIGVTVGPGMFTSLRVGLSAAKGLALPWSIPVKGIGTLSALARTAASAGPPSSPAAEMPVSLVLVDARKQQVYYGLYARGRPILPPSVALPEELPAILNRSLVQGSSLTLCGNAAMLCRSALLEAGFVTKDSGVELPDACSVAEAAKETILKQGGDNPETLVPVYLRRTDAELRRTDRSPKS